MLFGQCPHGGVNKWKGASLRTAPYVRRGPLSCFSNELPHLVKRWFLICFLLKVQIRCSFFVTSAALFLSHSSGHCSCQYFSSAPVYLIHSTTDMNTDHNAVVEEANISCCGVKYKRNVVDGKKWFIYFTTKKLHYIKDSLMGGQQKQNGKHCRPQYPPTKDSIL